MKLLNKALAVFVSFTLVVAMCPCSAIAADGASGGASALGENPYEYLYPDAYQDDSVAWEDFEDLAEIYSVDGSDDGDEGEENPDPVKPKKPTASELVRILGKASGKKKLMMLNTDKKIPSKQRTALNKAIKSIAKGHKMGFVAINLDTGEGFSYDADANIHSASTLKGPYLAAISKYQTKKASKSCYRGRYYSMIHYSSNEAYASLRSSFGSSSMRKLMSAAKVKDISASVPYQHIKVKSLAKLWVPTWFYLNSGTKQAKRIRPLYKWTKGSEVYSAFKGRKGYTTYSKGGWYPGAPKGYYTSYNTAGVVIRPDGTRYLVAVMTTLNCYSSETKKSRKLVRAIDAAMGALAKVEDPTPVQPEEPEIPADQEPVVVNPAA